MRYYLYLALLILPGCHSQSTDSLYPGQTEAALIFENGLAYDGCTERIQLLSDSLLYGPTAASLSILQKALSDIPHEPNEHSRAVTIRYLRTGQKTIIQCGWGASRQVDELAVLAITKR